MNVKRAVKKSEIGLGPAVAEGSYLMLHARWGALAVLFCTARSRLPLRDDGRQHRDQSALRGRQRRQYLHAQDAARAAPRFRGADGGRWGERLREGGCPPAR